ncbi:hypothetical protein ACVXHM_33570 [Pseudomonas aeruginosa]|uniref:hypothetical protein n=1 Tax=Pseudomonadaceae TaxID=135621 RepID=UPI00300E2FF5
MDESGDHGQGSVYPNYPVFVLAFCVFHKSHYAQRVAPSTETFKFKHYGHDLVILPETISGRGKMASDSTVVSANSTVEGGAASLHQLDSRCPYLCRASLALCTTLP